jgi:hypothetical protein
MSMSVPRFCSARRLLADQIDRLRDFFGGLARGLRDRCRVTRSSWWQICRGLAWGWLARSTPIDQFLKNRPFCGIIPCWSRLSCRLGTHPW